MGKEEIIERLEEIAKHAVHVLGEKPFFMSLDDGIAIHEAIDILKSAQPERCEDCETFSKTRLLISQPEIVRCKDCVHRFIDGENVRFNVCELNHNKVQADDWYCADAERRTDE